MTEIAVTGTTFATKGTTVTATVSLRTVPQTTKSARMSFTRAYKMVEAFSEGFYQELQEQPRQIIIIVLLNVYYKDGR